jgi:hypothetical protein
MPELTMQAIVHRQVRLLMQVCDTLTMRAIAGQRGDLDSLFLAQEHLEHWLQYLTPLALDVAESPLDAPPPLPSMRPAPPLPHEEEIFARAHEAMERQAALEGLDETLRPRVTFPPDPLWVEDLERDQGEER